MIKQDSKTKSEKERKDKRTRVLALAVLLDGFLTRLVATEWNQHKVLGVEKFGHLRPLCGLLDVLITLHLCLVKHHLLNLVQETLRKSSTSKEK